MSFQIQRDALIPFISLRYPHIINNPEVSVDKKKRKRNDFFPKKKYILLCLGSPYKNRRKLYSFPKGKNETCKSKKKKNGKNPSPSVFLIGCFCNLMADA